MAKAVRRKKTAAKGKPAKRPRCAAQTKAGTKCKNSASPRGKYCASHKGWRPPAKKKAKPKPRAKKKR